VKKYFWCFIVSVLVVMIPNVVQAASANIRVSSSSSTVLVGSTVTVNVTLSSNSAMGSWEFLVSYNSNYLQLISSNTESGGTKAAGYVSNGNTKSKTYTLKFKALRSGSATVSVGSYLVYGYDESPMSVSTSSASVRIMTYSELQSTYSKDNNLKSLTIDGYEISPSFSSDVTEYSVSVPSTVDKVQINAVKNESHATINGTGEHEVVEGNNLFEIKVVAQNGDEKVYKLNVVVEDKNPIVVSLNGKDYTIVKNNKNITKPELYEESKLTIQNVEVPVYVNNTIHYVLVALKDEEGNVVFAVYHEDTNQYELYYEQRSHSMVISIMDPVESLEGYQETTLQFNNVSYKVFQLKEDSDYAVVYGMNIETGEKGFYLYKISDNTFQSYYDEYISILKEEKQKYQYVILGFAGGCVFLILIVLYLFLRKPKKKDLNVKIEKSKVLEESAVKNQEEAHLDNSLEIKDASVKQKAKKKSKKQKSNKQQDLSKNSKDEPKGEDNVKNDEQIPEQLAVEDAIEKMNNVEEMIREYEKTLVLSKKELAQKKEEMKQNETVSKEENEVTEKVSTERMEETMFDLFQDERKKKKKRKKL